MNEPEFENLRKSHEEFKNRKNYTIINPEIIKTIPDNLIEQAINDYLIQKWKGNPNQEYKIIRNCPVGFMIVYSTITVEGEVNNGGFNQYFYNSSGIFAKDASTSYRKMGLTELSDIVDKSIVIYNKEKGLLNKFKKIATLEAFSESYRHTKLNELDEEFCRKSELATPIRIKFIKNNIELFK